MKLRTHPLATFERLEQVCKQRLALPTDKQLAEELEMPVSYVRWKMWEIRRRLSNILQVSRESNLGDTAQ